MLQQSTVLKPMQLGHGEAFILRILYDPVLSEFTIIIEDVADSIMAMPRVIWLDGLGSIELQGSMNFDFFGLVPEGGFLYFHGPLGRDPWGMQSLFQECLLLCRLRQLCACRHEDQLRLRLS